MHNFLQVCFQDDRYCQELSGNPIAPVAVATILSAFPENYNDKLNVLTFIQILYLY